MAGWTRFVLRFRWPVLGLWLIVLLAGGYASTRLSPLLENSFTVPGTDSERARHILERIRNDLVRTPDDRLAAQLAELEGYLPPPRSPGADHLGFAVPLRLSTSAGELRLITAITTFATAADVTVSELKLETFLPADAETAQRLVSGNRG